MFTNIHSDWQNILFDEKSRNLLNTTLTTIAAECKDNELCPTKELIFEFARYPLTNVKIIIIGMDPYTSREHAHGLAFSSLSKKVPPSLKNIYKCLFAKGLISEMPKTANLSDWVNQGVMLLNFALTTKIGKSGSHLKHWKPYSINILKNLSEYGVQHNIKYIFMLWGKNAQGLKKFINIEHHTILEWLHPSPMSQASATEADKFIHCAHFSLANQLLIDNNMGPINWNIGSITICKNDKIQDSIIQSPEIKINYIVGKDSSATTLKWYSDGSCTSNGTKNSVGGAAAACVSGYLKDTIILIGTTKDKKPATNIRMEGLAIIHILELMFKKIKSNDWRTCQIYTDSEFWLKMIFNYMPKWSATDFKNKANPDLTIKMWKLWNDIMSAGKDLEIIHVYAHNKSGGQNSVDVYKKWCYDNNALVDELANWSRVNLKPCEIRIIN